MKKVGIIGSGIIGLSVAIELRERGYEVTVITRNYEEGASWTSGGMLAPFSEGLKDNMLELCIESLNLYDEYIKKIESVAGFGVDYRRNGILRIAMDEEEEKEILSTAETYKSMGIDLEIVEGKGLKEKELLLADQIKKGVLYRQEGGVDTERLMDALLLSCEKMGIRIILDEIKEIDLIDGRVKKVTGLKQYYTFDFYVIATGAWNEIIPHIPVFPVKGQLLKIKGIPIERILFSNSVYIIPKENHILIGATSEDAGFDTRATLGGINQLSSRAIKVIPKLSEASFHNVLVGFRPSTPDESPVFEAGENYTIAVGHYRNGILLSPVTAKMVADFITGGKLSRFFEVFSPGRFK